MAAAAAYKPRDTTVADEGFAQVVSTVLVHKDVVEYLKSEEAFETLTDFVNPFADMPAEKRHAEFEEIVKKARVNNAIRREEGRLKTAWEIGRDALNFAAQGAAAVSNTRQPADWEDPLSEKEIQDLDNVWTTRYHFVFEAHVQPGDPLLNRLYREFRRWAMTLTEVGKMKSFLMEKASAEKVQG